MQLTANPADRRLADELWALAGFSSCRSTVVINNSAATAPTRVWSLERIKQLARSIAVSSDSQVLLHCGPSEREATNRWASEINLPNVVSMGILNELPIGLSKAVLERASVVVSTDSGPRHMAVAMDRKVITLYGPTDPAWTTTYNVPEIAVQENLPCRACYKAICPLQHHRCMEDIDVTRVLAAVYQARQHLQAA
jgi:heptosyltransferase II